MKSLSGKTAVEDLKQASIGIASTIGNTLSVKN